MASLYNYSTKTYEPVDDREVTERVKAGQYTFQSGKKVKIRLPNGELYEIEPEKTQKAFKLGATFVTAEEEREIGLKEKYGQGWGNALSAFALGTLSGATLSGSNIALVESGIINKETLDAYRKYQSGAYIGGDIAGSVGSILATGGLATAAQAGVRGARAANVAAHVLMPSAILAKGASAIGRGVTGAAAGNAAKLLAKGAGEGIGKTRNAIVLGALAEGAVDAAGYATAEHLTEYYLGNPNKNAETFLGNLGMSTVLGGGLSALIPGVRHLVKPMSAEKSMDVLRYATGRFVDTSKGRVEVSQRLAEQEGITLDEAMQRTAANVDSALWRQSVDEDVLRYNDTLTDIKTAIEEKESFIERLTAERDLDLDDIGPALTEAKRRVDELTKKKADLDDTSALEDARRQAQEDTLSFRERYNREIEKQNLEVENLVAAKSQAQDTLFSLKQERDRIVDEGKTMLSREIETQRDRAVSAVNQVYDLVEDGKALARGAHRNSVLVRGIESTTEEGTRGVDMIDAFYLEIANRRTQMENARGRPGVDSAEIDTVIGVLDAIEDEVNDVLAKVGKFETNPVAKVSRATGKKKTAEDLAREGQKADFRKAITSKAVDGPELDLAIKRAMFTTLDENRKVLGDIIFNHARDGKIAWNTQSLLKDTWLGFKVLQSHKSFGKAGEQIGQVTEAFSRLLEADQQFSSYFMAPKRFEREGRRYTDQDKLERFFSNPNKSHERKEGLNRYLQAANNLITISENAGLYAKVDDVVDDVVDVQAVAEKAANRWVDAVSESTRRIVNNLPGSLNRRVVDGIENDINKLIQGNAHYIAAGYASGVLPRAVHKQFARELEDLLTQRLKGHTGTDLWPKIQQWRPGYEDRDKFFGLSEIFTGRRMTAAREELRRVEPEVDASVGLHFDSVSARVQKMMDGIRNRDPKVRRLVQDNREELVRIRHLLIQAPETEGLDVAEAVHQIDMLSRHFKELEEEVRSKHIQSPGEHLDDGSAIQVAAARVADMPLPTAAVDDVVDVEAVALEAAYRYKDELAGRANFILDEISRRTDDPSVFLTLEPSLEDIIQKRSDEAQLRYLDGEMTPEFQEEVARDFERVVRDTLEEHQSVDYWDEVLDDANIIQELRARYSLKERAYPEEMPVNDATLVSLSFASKAGDGGQLAAKMRTTYEQAATALNDIENSLITQLADSALLTARSTAEMLRKNLNELDTRMDWDTKDIWIEQNTRVLAYLDELADYLERNADALFRQSNKLPVERIAVDAYQSIQQMSLPALRMREVAVPETLAGKLAKATRETNESMDEIGNLLEDTEALRAIKGGGRAVEPAGHPVHDSIRALQELSLREKDAGAALDQQIAKHRDAKAIGRDLKASRLEELSQREQAEAAAQGDLEFEQARRSYEIGEVEDELAYTEAQAAILGRDVEGLKGTVEHYQNLERAGIADLKDMAYGRMPYEATGGPFGPKPKPTELQRPEAYLPRLPESGAGAIGDLTASGTTSIPGLAMYQVGGWQGAALGSIGFSSVIQALRSGADPQRRWMAYLQAYDTMVRYQHNRKRIVSDFLSGELKKATVDRKASPFRLMLGSLMQFGEFEGLFEASSGDDFTDATARLHTINSKPELKMKILEEAVAGLDPSMPKHAAAIQKQLATCLDYLGEQCPKEPQTNLLALTRRSNWRPSDSEVFSFQTGCVEPLESQLETLQNGLAQRTITPRQVTTWQVCMPSFYADCAEDMYSGFAELKEPAPYDVRTVASVFLGSHVEPTRQAPFVQGMQGMFNQQTQPIGDAASATRGRSEAALTPSQERQQRIA